ncbi:FecR protein [Planctomycetes bacterium CA13]|uniref:FecR protein n=1 Tax=Novipirellula herctigrandis TaxID=2527986 RepID=A0A5C5Z3H7_9BACT|nr:FecR protein [Planctomycetes bacterium CA13]
MNQSSDNWETRLEELVGALRDDSLSDDQSVELQNLLKTQPGARRRFAEAMHLSAMLGDAGAISGTGFQPVVGEFTGVQPVPHSKSTSNTLADTRRFRTIAMILLASSATILFAMLWARPQGVEDDFHVELFDEGVAVVTQSYDTRWTGKTQLQVGSSVSPGKVELQSGLIQLEFYRGAVVVVEGPAELEFVNADRLICRRGRLRAHVPPQAEGFAVVSPNVELVDLGTEFGMDVADDGSASVHVFDGKVELYESGTDRSAETRQEFTETEGALVSAGGKIVASKTKLVEFVSSSELLQLASARNTARLQQWKSKRQSLIDDPRVAIHYSFEKDPISSRLLRSHASDSLRLDGAIIGCRWTEGRWLGKNALEFKHPGDRVRLQIPGEFDSLTYSAWVRIDGLDRPFIALVLTNGYEVGEPHWQLRDDGRLLLGIQTPSGHVAYDSKPVLNIKHLGRWTHLATVYDSDSARVTHYINGESVGVSPITTDNFKLRFGETEIGNWGTPAKYSPQKIRNFNGQIDELTIFGKPLTASEIRAIYADGLR